MEAQLSIAQRFRIAKARSKRLLREWDESQHPRVPAGSPDGGEFGSGGGGGGDGDKPDISDAHLDPKVVAVGGDAWNKATARRLEREYQTAKPKLQEMLDKLGGGESSGSDSAPKADEEHDEEADEPVHVPEEWEEMNPSDQTDVEETYYAQELEKYVDNEKENWLQSGGALDQAKSELADISGGFVHDAVKEYMTEKDDDGEPLTETKFPYTPSQINSAISLDYESDGEGHGKLTVSFNDDELQEPTNAPPKEQGTLPGIEPEDLSKRLTPAMRKELTTMLTEKFDETAEEKSGDMEPPEYLAEQAKEYMEETWQHNMSDSEKFNYAKYSTDTIKDLQELAGNSAAAAPDENIRGLPGKFDPLNETSGADYKKTQKLAREISLQRAEQVFKDRGIEMKPGVVPKVALKRLDNELWSAWKASSTSTEGQLLQVATADELGGRLNPKTGRDGKVELDKDKIRTAADKEYEGIGGYAAIKAYVRAKWETTQFLLDKAGISELPLYRGIVLDNEKYGQAEREKMLELLDLARKQMIEGGYSKVPNLNVVRNGAASTTISASVANNWQSDSTRVVLRALMPRTAAVSVPAYGINVKSEQEVVVAGTAWKAWDAWLGKAPTFDRVAMAA